MTPDNMMSRLEALVRVKAQKISDKKIKKIRDRFVAASRIWRNAIKRNLSRPSPNGTGWSANGVKNDSDTPYMRSGALKNSVPIYGVTTRKTFGSGGGRSGVNIDLDQTVIIMQQTTKAPWTTYGEALDNWSEDPTSLPGWKQRAYDELDRVINKVATYDLLRTT